MPKIRHPAVAGLFYPADPIQLRQMVQEFLRAAASGDGAPPKAIIAPHAGYIYSGPVAASAYARLAPLRGTVTRVVLLGPSHRVGFLGLASSSADYFRTPLGDIPLDRAAVDSISPLPQVHALDEAHSMEHSLEVHLPFLQEVLGEFALVPLVVGDASAQEVDEVLEQLWGGPETLIVISSDLSHYHEYATAQAMDRRTAQAIEELRYQDLRSEAACGRNPVRGLLLAARRRGLHATTIDLRNSGDTAGPRDQVVGYGAWLFREAA
ncbi:AmmeMemoRadiSam system protein B [Sulfurivermis fontis]|uniref:AmmeMemoRadiSam system protein B n=1 Tax=Sulfurivermis fontis TaxID=1972068 RepID=UPI000FDAF143|nr:AmmeMemoRadiSam system protein B [Sulfurivermis fontis]